MTKTNSTINNKSDIVHDGVELPATENALSYSFNHLVVKMQLYQPAFASKSNSCPVTHCIMNLV